MDRRAPQVGFNKERFPAALSGGESKIAADIVFPSLMPALTKETMFLFPSAVRT